MSLAGASPAVVLLAHAHPAWEDFGVLEWLVLGSALVFMAWSIWRAVKYTLHPGETEPDHIKRLVLQEPRRIETDVSWGPGEAPDA